MTHPASVQTLLQEIKKKNVHLLGNQTCKYFPHQEKKKTYDMDWHLVHVKYYRL